MQWFDKRQRHICTKRPEMIRHVKKGVENALEECRRQFKDYRWNCSPLTWNQVFSEEGLLKKRECFVVGVALQFPAPISIFKRFHLFKE